MRSKTDRDSGSICTLEHDKEVTADLFELGVEMSQASKSFHVC